MQDDSNWGFIYMSYLYQKSDITQKVNIYKFTYSIYLNTPVHQ